MLLVLNLIEHGKTHGDIFSSIYRERYRSFVERQNYDTFVFADKYEHDRYDTPSTYYLVNLDSERRVRGTIRLNPMSGPTMLHEIFSDMAQYEELPTTQSCWEGTRICIDKNLESDLRETIKKQLVVGTIEFLLTKSATQLYGMMQNIIFRNVYEKSGCEVTYIGPTKIIGSQKCRIARTPVSSNALMVMRHVTGIKAPVIENIILDHLEAA